MNRHDMLKEVLLENLKDLNAQIVSESENTITFKIEKAIPRNERGTEEIESLLRKHNFSCDNSGGTRDQEAERWAGEGIDATVRAFYGNDEMIELDLSPVFSFENQTKGSTVLYAQILKEKLTEIYNGLLLENIETNLDRVLAGASDPK